MIFEILSLFPSMLEGPLGESLFGKARQAGLVQVRFRDIRDYAEGKHRVCDDSPYGGGAGMVMKPEPVVAAIEAARRDAEGDPHVILLTPQGKVLDQPRVRDLARQEHLVLVCGRYEGMDERVRAYVDEEISIGDFVLSGGEPAALVLVDAVFRLIPGALGNDASALHDSFSEGLLEHPQYTRPPEFRGMKVPDVLLSGDHARIAKWRRKTALHRTRERRPDLLEKHPPEAADLALLREDD